MVIEYKFTVMGTNQEGFTEGSPCTITSGGFTNRSYEVIGDATLDVVCWSTCRTPRAADVTFNVNMANETVSAEGVFPLEEGRSQPQTTNDRRRR